MFKKYFKYKLSSLIKDKLLYYSSLKENYTERLTQLKDKVYDGNCISKERFDEINKENIKFCLEQLREYNNKFEATLDILKIVENL